MKQETEALVEWIKCQVSISQDQSAFITKDAEERFRTNQIKAIQFLDSLPEIESHLCNGGYIQDRNGTPCCYGDRIKFKISENSYMKQHIEKHGSICTGILKWNPVIRAFIILFDNPCWDGDWIDFSAGNDDIIWFEKVEK